MDSAADQEKGESNASTARQRRVRVVTPEEEMAEALRFATPSLRSVKAKDLKMKVKPPKNNPPDAKSSQKKEKPSIEEIAPSIPVEEKPAVQESAPAPILKQTLVSANVTNSSFDVAVYMILVVLSIGLYINSMNGEFAFDDRFAVVENDDSKSTTPLWNILWHDFWGQDISNIESHKSYRPLTILSFRINHAIDNESTFGYHLGNVILHTITCTLAYFVGIRLGYSREASAIASILFSIHPVHTESVSGIVGRADVLSSVFFLLALLFYMSGAHADSSDFRKLTIAGLFYIASTLAKETGFTVLAVMFLYDLILVPNQSPLIPFVHKKRNSKVFLVRLGYLVVLGMFYILGRKWITVHFTLYNYRQVENPIAYTEGVSRILSILYLHSRYAWLLVFPFYLSVDYSFNCVPVIESPGEWRNICWILLYGTMFWVIWMSFRDMHKRNPFSVLSEGKSTKKSKKTSKDESDPQRDAQSPDNMEDEAYKVDTFVDPNRFLFSLGFLVATFVPSSNLFVFVGTMIAERLLYMPSLGFCYMFGHLFESYPVKVKGHVSLRNFVVGMVLVTFSFRTWTRNFDWQSEELLFKKAMDVCPDSVKVRLNNGILHRRYSNWDDAFYEFNKALEIMPSFCEPYHWIALTHINSGETLDIAKPFLRLGVQCKYTRGMTLRALNSIYDLLTKTDQSSIKYIEEWAEILTLAEQDAEASKYYRMMGMHYRNENNTQMAIKALERSIELDPESCESNYWLGVTVMEVENQTKAVPYFEKSLKCDHAVPATMHALAPIYDRMVVEDPSSIDLKIRFADLLMRGNLTVQAAKLYYIAGRESVMKFQFAQANRSFRKVVAAHQRILAEVETLGSSYQEEAQDIVNNQMWCDVHLWYGRSLMSTGNMNEALTHLTIVTKCGNDEAKHQARDFIEKASRF